MIEKLEKIINAVKKVILHRTTYVSVGILIVVTAFFIFQNKKPTSLSGMIGQGEKFEKAGKLSSALQSYERAARYFPASYNAHMKLGNLLIQVKEFEKAKIEYYRAVKLGNVRNYDAYFALANIYSKENNFVFAHEILSSLRDVPNSRVQERSGDFHYEWGLALDKVNKFDSLREYKEAYEFYKKAHSRKAVRAKILLEKTYIKIADKLIADGKFNDAIKMLELSVEFDNSPLAHYKLARLYEKFNPDLAITEYEKAFKLNNYYVLDRRGYISLLIKKAQEYRSQGDFIQSDYYYNKAKHITKDVKIPYIEDKHIILSLLAGRYNENVDKDIIIPGISFRIMNVSNQKITYLKVKIVFLDNEKPHSENEILIANAKTPLMPDGVSDIFNVFSSTPITKVFATHNIKVSIYISQSQPDKWKLYRNAYFANKKTAPDEEYNY